MIGRRKEMFIPNCEKDMDTGNWICEPVLRQEGVPDMKSEQPIILKPMGGNFEIIKGMGAPEVLINRLEKHFQHHKLMK